MVKYFSLVFTNLAGPNFRQSILLLFFLFVACWHEIIQPEEIILTEYRREEIHQFSEAHQC